MFFYVHICGLQLCGFTPILLDQTGLPEEDWSGQVSQIRAFTGEEGLAYSPGTATCSLQTRANINLPFPQDQM